MADETETETESATARAIRLVREDGQTQALTRLHQKLAEMELNDNLYGAYETGYMAARREILDWALAHEAGAGR